MQGAVGVMYLKGQRCSSLLCLQNRLSDFLLAWYHMFITMAESSLRLIFFITSPGNSLWKETYGPTYLELWEANISTKNNYN